jgi:cytochrome b pre-mRNA-processing protein 3
MILDRVFRQRPTQAMGRALYARAVEQSRSAALYADYGAPDTVEGRFEIYTLHVVLLLERLRGHGDQAAETSQSLFDTYVKALDHALRELGVGDLSVGKKMRRLGEAFYGRGKSYASAFAALPATAELEALLTRTVFADAESPRTAELTAYVMRQRAALANQPLDGLLAGEVVWGPL